MIAMHQLSLFDDVPLPEAEPKYITTITLWQPWASLVALRLKQVETRSWQRSYRGLLAIHAAQEPFRMKDYQGQEWAEFRKHLNRLYDAGEIDYWNLPTGCILAVADLTDIQPVEDIRLTLTAQERAFGDYSTEPKPRYGWMLENIRALEQPILATGNRQLWHWTPSADEWSVIEALRAA